MTCSWLQPAHTAEMTRTLRKRMGGVGSRKRTTPPPDRAGKIHARDPQDGHHPRMTPRALMLLGVGAALAITVCVSLQRHFDGEAATKSAPLASTDHAPAAPVAETPVDASLQGYSPPEAQMNDDAGWSAPLHGVQIRLSTDKKVYRKGEPIELVLTYRNVDSGLWVLRMGPDSKPQPGSQFDDSPLYDLSTLMVTEVGAREQWKLTPVQSAKFYVSGHLERLDPGTVRSAYGRLTTWAWTTRNPRTAGRDEPLAAGLPPGKYSLTGHSQQPEVELRVGDHRGEEALESLRQFFLGADTSIEAFQGHRFVGINYTEALLLRDAGYRVWSGALDSPPWEFIVEP
jgi:hypothetical protein